LSLDSIAGARIPAASRRDHQVVLVAHHAVRLLVALRHPLELQLRARSVTVSFAFAPEGCER
jgi:hypothetical protein